MPHTPGRMVDDTKGMGEGYLQIGPTGEKNTLGHPRFTASVYVEDFENGEDIKRIVACWNGCEGIANPLAVPDLLAALNRLVGWCPNCKGTGIMHIKAVAGLGSSTRPCDSKRCKDARAAIAKATGPNSSGSWDRVRHAIVKAKTRGGK